MAYTPIGWLNKTDTPPLKTPLNKTNLNHMDQGIVDLYTEMDNFEIQLNDILNNKLKKIRLGGIA
jgi:hypothetical protein